MEIKKGYVISGLVLILFFAGIFSVTAALLHSANDFLIKVNDSVGTLNQAISGGYFVVTNTYSYVQPLDPGHSASEIWVSVKDGEMYLLQALSSANKLCPASPLKTSYSGPTDKTKAYHYANEIEISAGKSFQQAINNGEFCCVCQVGICISGVCTECTPGTTRIKDCDYLDTMCRNYNDVTDTCTSSGTWTNPSCTSYTNIAKGTICSGGTCGGYWGCNGVGNCVCVSGTLACSGSSTSSIALSYSYSNSLSSQVSIFLGTTKLITYTGTAGSGTYTKTGLGSDATYTFYLRDGNTASSRLLAQISCSTQREEREDPPEEPPDYSNLPNRILDGDDDGGKVICTELYSTGVLDGETYKMDVKYASEHFSKEAIHGYQAWAIPVVKFMRKSPEETERVIIPLVNSFMEEIAYRSGKRETGNEVGKLFLDEGVPLFERIGGYIDEPDWESLFNQNWLDRILKNGDFLLYYIFNYKYLLQKEDKYDKIVENYFTEQKVREMFYDAERRGGNSQLAIAKALVENLGDAVDDIESLITSA